MSCYGLNNMIDIARIKKLLNTTTDQQPIRIHGIDGKPHRLERQFIVENNPIESVLKKLEKNREFYTFEGKFNNGLLTGTVTLKYQ